MPIDANTIEQLMLKAIPDANIRIDDLRGDGDHYAAYVESASFAGKSRVEQHKMVFDALQDKVGGELHALALQTSVPKE